MKNTFMRLIAALILVVMGVAAFAQQQTPNTPPGQRKYATYGRNPMVKGGLTPDQAKARGWTPFQLPEDAWATMWGAGGESVDIWHQAGIWVAWDDQNRLRILECGNLTNLVRVPVPVPGEKIQVKGDTEFIPVPYMVPGKTEFVDRPGPIEYRDRYLPIMILAPQQQYIAPMGGTTVISPVLNGIPGFNFSRISANGYGAAAAAAAAAASTSSTAVTPTSGAGTSGSGGSGSSGAAGGGGGSSGSGSK